MLEAAENAARIAMSFFRRDPGVWYKNGDRSPVSEADIAIDKKLKHLLLGARPDYGWLSEEAEDDDRRLSRRRVFVVDPIDGTRAYIGGRKDWCVSIGLVEDGVPVAGVLAAPARKEIWKAVRGGGAHLNDVALNPTGAEAGSALRLVVPDAVKRAMRTGHAPKDSLPGGPSLALRVAAVASGEFDAVYIRPHSNEWDLAAADVMLRETGHEIVGQAGDLMRYNEPDPSRSILLAARRDLIPELLAPLQPPVGH
ncbi:3'(2'),5'-bisphosphate nucleotidase CysQ [Hoeflea sp.]